MVKIKDFTLASKNRGHVPPAVPYSTPAHGGISPIDKCRCNVRFIMQMKQFDIAVLAVSPRCTLGSKPQHYSRRSVINGAEPSRERGRTHLRGSTQIGGGNLPSCPMLATALLAVRDCLLLAPRSQLCVRQINSCPVGRSRIEVRIRGLHVSLKQQQAIPSKKAGN